MRNFGGETETTAIAHTSVANQTVFFETGFLVAINPNTNSDFYTTRPANLKWTDADEFFFLETDTSTPTWIRTMIMDQPGNDY